MEIRIFAQFSPLVINNMQFNYIELLGYAASFVIVLSFALQNVTKIRIVNSIGCFLFVVYGLLISGIPVVVANGAIVVINMYYLIKHKKQ
jgi:uncharacterized protein with PQ loop repeat